MTVGFLSLGALASSPAVALPGQPASPREQGAGAELAQSLMSGFFAPVWQAQQLDVSNIETLPEGVQADQPTLEDTASHNVANHLPALAAPMQMQWLQPFSVDHPFTLPLATPEGQGLWMTAPGPVVPEPALRVQSAAAGSGCPVPAAVMGGPMPQVQTAVVELDAQAAQGAVRGATLAMWLPQQAVDTSRPVVQRMATEPGLPLAGAANQGAVKFVAEPAEAPTPILGRLDGLPQIAKEVGRPQPAQAAVLLSDLGVQTQAVAPTMPQALQRWSLPPAQANGEAQPVLSANQWSSVPQVPDAQPLPGMPAVAVKSVAQPLVQALAQRIEMQYVQGQETVTVRLDPPDLGSLEIRIQQQGNGVQVLLQASHTEVGRQLTAVAEGLRQELQSRSGVEASVTVAQHSRQGGDAHQQERRQPAWQQPEWIGQALQEGHESERERT